MAEEEDRRAKWRKENIRRRHNYLPFIVELLRGLADQGELVSVYQRAKTKALEREKKKVEKDAKAV
jgi:ubiquitin carboxyl-terminal hydrolase L5